MANKFPYVASAGPLVKTVSHLRKSFPKEVTAETLRKLGVAPKNESYVINVLKFLGVVDDAGAKVGAKAKAFVQHQDDAFASEFETVVKDAYEELFELHGDAAWQLDRGALTQFFRTTDNSSDVVGSRQASTFEALAALSGHADIPTPKPNSAVPRNTQAKVVKKAKKVGAAEPPAVEPAPVAAQSPSANQTGSVGLTVRIEVNLPVAGDQDTYDRIFRSIRENLIDGNTA